MKLFDYLPSKTYNGESYTKDFLQAVGKETEKLWSAWQDLLLQISPYTATWGLSFYEKEYGILSDLQKPLEQRRSLLIARMRSRGTTTPEKIKKIADSYANGSVEVEEHNGEYWIELVFTSHIGVPSNIQDLLETLEIIKPAHLGLGYKEVFNTHEYLSQFPHEFLFEYTHEELRRKKLDEDFENWEGNYNIHETLSTFTHKELSKYTHEEIRRKKLDKE